MYNCGQAVASNFFNVVERAGRAKEQECKWLNFALLLFRMEWLVEETLRVILPYGALDFLLDASTDRQFCTSYL